jgi:hypothetical protein
LKPDWANSLQDPILKKLITKKKKKKICSQPEQHSETPTQTNKQKAWM